MALCDLNTRALSCRNTRYALLRVAKCRTNRLTKTTTWPTRRRNETTHSVDQIPAKSSWPGSKGPVGSVLVRSLQYQRFAWLPKLKNALAFAKRAIMMTKILRHNGWSDETT